MPSEKVIEFAQPLIDLREHESSPYKNVAIHIGDCALNHAELPKLIAYLKAQNIEGWRSIPADGARKRTLQEWQPYLEALLEAGTEYLEFTLYGKQATHDWFAGRKGSYEAIHLLASLWHENGGKTVWCQFVHKKNLPELSGIQGRIQEEYEIECPVKLWSYSGRGAEIETLRIDRLDLEKVPQAIQEELLEYRTETEWVQELRGDQQAPFAAKPFVIRLVVDHTGQASIPYTTASRGHDGLSCGNVIGVSMGQFIEKWQQVYGTWQRRYPRIGVLCDKYGCGENEKLYDKKSIIRKWSDAFEVGRHPTPHKL